MITIAEDQRSFERDGAPFFYLADTCWSAFTNADTTDWDRYLAKRRQQGFTAIQVNVLSQWDRSVSRLDVLPFAVLPGGKYDFDALNEAYFDRAVGMTQTMVDRGLVPVLTLLWANFIEGTWASDKDGMGTMTIPQAESCLRYVLDRFRPFTPIYFAAGDTDFSAAANPYIALALRLVKELSPDSPAAIHISGALGNLPAEFIDHPDVDFYVYNSGHHREIQQNAYRTAETMYANAVKRPVVNGEPVYEQMGIQHEYGRWRRCHSRRALWWSLLSGAGAGIAHGAYGIWNWRDRREVYGFADGESGAGGFDCSLDWIEALSLNAAGDFAFAKDLITTMGLREILPANSRYRPRNTYGEDTDDIRVGTTPDANVILVYLPASTCLSLQGALDDYAFRFIDLAGGSAGELVHRVEGGVTRFPLAPFLEDALLIGTRRQ